MFKTKIKKLAAFVLISFMSVGLLGTTLAEAHPHEWPPHRHEEPRRDPPPQNNEGHSTGEVTTAAIVGAVVGAIIAKKT